MGGEEALEDMEGGVQDNIIERGGGSVTFHLCKSVFLIQKLCSSSLLFLFFK